MNKYEILFVLTSGLEESAYEAAVEKYSTVITARGGSVEKVDKWGMRKLAYPINYKTEGYYVVMQFTADGETPAEIERQMRISDDVIRFLVTSAQ